MNTWSTKKPKVLYGLQTTGCGHLSRGVEILPYLQKVADVDLLVSGPENDFDFPFEIKYRYKGLGFIFGNGGNIDYLKTLLDANLPKVFSEGKSLPIKDYDLVITDFEPVCAWAAKMAKVPCIGVGNQYAFTKKASKFYVRSQQLHRFFIQFFAPCHRSIAIDYEGKGDDIYTPIIRSHMRTQSVSNGDHYTIYLNTYSVQEVEKVVSLFPGQSWHIFSERIDKPSTKNNVQYFPIGRKAFRESLNSCKGFVTGAGFSSTSEALFLNKKLLVVPTKMQFEQKANARVLRRMGVTVIKTFHKRWANSIKLWLEEGQPLQLDYPHHTQALVDHLLRLAAEVKEEL